MTKSTKQNQDLDLLRYSVVFIDNHPAENPADWLNNWEVRNHEPPSWDAELDAHEFAELCREFNLRASCMTQGTQGAAGFAPHHWVPAYCFCDGDEDYQAWVTPWTPAIKAAALAAIAGQSPTDMPVLGAAQPVSVVWVPLWGDHWTEVEQMLEREFADECDSSAIKPVERLEVEP